MVGGLLAPTHPELCCPLPAHPQLKTMRQEDYMKTISDLELHYQEFIRNSQGSEMFGDDDKRKMQCQFTDAQKHYQTLVIQLPGHPQHQTGELLALSRPFPKGRVRASGL